MSMDLRILKRRGETKDSAANFRLYLTRLNVNECSVSSDKALPVSGRSFDHVGAHIQYFCSEIFENLPGDGICIFETNSGVCFFSRCRGFFWLFILNV